ncbi:MAG TPA: OmpA family protein [Candidatus Kapabacteria bacterium]|jgi:outer membrane protein OmpA-like peptidoglycan-associated protein|nr:OmpA family protein [Candidatus Kapabacteria bacterium]
MKKLFAFALVPVVAFSISSCGSLASSLKNTVENTATGKIDDKASEETGAAMDTMLGNGHGSSAQNNTGTSNTSVAGQPANAPQTITAYQNYDFKPGENIVFDDNFVSDQDGEFPAHWHLENGQGVVNGVNGQPAFLLTEGNYVLVTPRMKTDNYLSDPCTIEFDYFANHGYAPMVRFIDTKSENRDVHFGHSVETGYFPKDLSGSDIGSEEDYFNKWHHAAIIYKNGQMKMYLDNSRALVVPECGFVPASLKIGGIGGTDNPITIRNVRLANGGNSNTIGALLTNGKFVTHGITFDVGKATLRPESMGTLNDVAKFLKGDPAANFEIDGHTDNSGAAATNMTLSQQRADAVKAQLVTMGIDASRLSTKGFGASKPIAGNDTPEGMANNRRVEFVKM